MSLSTHNLHDLDKLFCAVAANTSVTGPSLTSSGALQTNTGCPVHDVSGELRAPGSLRDCVVALYMHVLKMAQLKCVVDAPAQTTGLFAAHLICPHSQGWLSHST